MRLIVVVGMLEIARYDFPSGPGELRVHIVPRWLSWIPGLGVNVHGKIGENEVRIHLRT